MYDRFMHDRLMRDEVNGFMDGVLKGVPNREQRPALETGLSLMLGLRPVERFQRRVEVIERCRLRAS